MEARPDLEQAADASADLRAALGRRRDAGEDLQQCGLARAVAPDDAEHLPVRDVEGDLPERPHVSLFVVVLTRHDAPHATGERIAERAVRGLVLTDPVPLREALTLIAVAIRSCPRSGARSGGSTRDR